MIKQPVEFSDLLEMETMSAMEMYPELYDVLALEEVGAKRPRSEEEAVAHTIATAMEVEPMYPVFEAVREQADVAPAEKKRKGGKSKKKASHGKTKEERREFLEGHVARLVASNIELSATVRTMEREMQVLQEQLVLLHQAQARMRMARKLEAAALPTMSVPFLPTIVSRSELA